MLGNRQRRGESREATFLNIYDGAIVRKSGLLEDKFDFVEGTLESITRKDVTLKDGSTKNYVYISLQSYGKTSERYILSFSEWSPVLFSLLMNLAGDRELNGLSTIRIEAYSLDGKTKINVFDNGNRLSWIKLQPPREEDRKRVFVSDLIERIKSRI